MAEVAVFISTLRFGNCRNGKGDSAEGSTFRPGCLSGPVQNMRRTVIDSMERRPGTNI